PPTPKSDPLGELVSQRTRVSPSGTAATDLTPRDVTFPRLLSDDEKTSTALAAVRPAAAQAQVQAAPIPTQPPPPSDRLPVVPLPAQALLEATPIVTHPRDSLTRAASDAAQLEAQPELDAPPGH